MIRKLSLALLLTLPSMSVAIDLEGYYITAKGGVSKTFNTGTTNHVDDQGVLGTFENNDLGTGKAFGVSVAKFLTDSFRLEIEAIKRTDYKFNVKRTLRPELGIFNRKAKIKTHALFINGFYDFEPSSLLDTIITPYLGGGVAISKNKMGTEEFSLNGVLNATNGDTTNQFAYKLSVGTLISLTQQLSLDVNYQYVNLGEFKGGTERFNDGVPTGIVNGISTNLQRGMNGGEIKTQELMVGLQYTF